MPRGVYVRSEETRKRMSRGQTGRKLSKEVIEKLSGPNSHRWIKELNSEKNYRAIHARIYKAYGKADHCENLECKGKSKKFEWSNKDHQYTFEREKWQQLCRSCHKLYDLRFSVKK